MLLALACACASGTYAPGTCGAATARPVDTILCPEAQAARAADQPVRLDFPNTLVVGDAEPTLIYAQRSIVPESPAPKTDPTQYTYVDIEGWKSPAQAGAMSFLVPGSGQLYTGASRGYIFLGIEALAIYTFTHFEDEADAARDDYYRYVGDPYQSGSRFSFARLGSSVDPNEVQRLQEIYAKDQREFYDTVTNDEQFAAGWDAGDSRGDAMFLATETDHFSNRSRFGLILGIANHVVAAFDALHLARLNNIALREDLTLKVKLKPSFGRTSVGFTLTQKF
jgi:hypothetical protein